MRPRIRSIKPEIHTDEELWDLEEQTGLKIFRAYTGLWNYSDREGRFEWRPRALKAMILPYWDGDFERVLDALAAGRFIVKYTVGGKHYGWVRTLKDHQTFNAREPASILPAPPSAILHVHARAANDSAHGELERGTRNEEWERELEAPRAHPHVASPDPSPEPTERADDPIEPTEPAPASVVAERPSPAVPPLGLVRSGRSRVVSLPGREPTKDYLDDAVMAGVSREQARSTWKHYWGAGLPPDGVERLNAWLVQRAAERSTQLAGHPARASPRGGSSPNPRASKQPNAGLTGFESLKGSS